MPMDPNFNRGTGRLTTDRFDFEKHTNGTNARHDGYAIDMVPPMIILGNPYTNVRTAIEALNAIIAPVSVQDATGSIKGILKLTQDLGGTADLPKVIAIQSRPVSALTPTTGQVLTWNGSAWEPQTSSSAFTASLDLSGTNISQTVVGIQGRSVASTAPSSGGVLEWNSGTSKWEPSNTVTSLTINATNNTITDTSIASGDILLSNGTKFVRKAKGSNGTFLGVSGGVVDYYTPPSVGVAGTGFVTATSSVFDPNATANIRYNSGKFQTDVAIQYRNGSFTGDLVWVPTTSRTIALPDATDTLVGKNTVDNLTNKTFDVAGVGNLLTSASQATGDLLKNNGTQFVRFGIGTSLQILRVNSGATDLEYASMVSMNSGMGPTITNSSSGLISNITDTVGTLLVGLIRFSAGPQVGGMLAPTDGYGRITLAATGSAFTIMHENGSSTAANRFTCPGGLNWQIADGYTAQAIYDNSSSRWRLSLGLGTVSV